MRNHPSVLSRICDYTIPVLAALENEAKEGRSVDKVISKKARAKLILIRCIFKSSLGSSYNSGAFRLHSLLAKALVQSCQNPLASPDYKSKVIVHFTAWVIDEICI